jgi:hypothetical protein
VCVCVFVCVCVCVCVCVFKCVCLSLCLTCRPSSADRGELGGHGKAAEAALGLACGHSPVVRGWRGGSRTESSGGRSAKPHPTERPTARSKLDFL